MSDLTLLQPGHSKVLGAHVEAGGVNFALTAPNADSVELCLFTTDGTSETKRLRLLANTNGVWHGFLPTAQPGLLYGWRVHGPWLPQEGKRFNPRKVMLDPCAKEVFGQYDGDSIHLGHDSKNPHQRDPRDNASKALKARVLEDLPKALPFDEKVNPSQRVIYEVHPKGFTALHPEIPKELRGSYAGLGHPIAIAYLQSLGVTTISLMPVAHRVDEARLLAAGLTNYWGYNPIAWDAPEARYWSGVETAEGCRYGHVRMEFRSMVDALHAAGLEVLIDVVYNHSGETDEWGPTLSLRGIDNALYYQLEPSDRAQYCNWTGCGNCLNLSEPLVLRTCMDSLRSWVTEFGVDGFRFDLAPVLARRPMADGGEFDPRAPFLAAIAQDPLLRGCTMVAEPWDIGGGGYRLGQFPREWLEWNDRFRDQQRGFWLHHIGTRGDFAKRISGSTDVFDIRRRAPHGSVNFVTAHDGFSLTDLVSYLDRHNMANGESNRDGHGHNLSVNFGVEGSTDDIGILMQRASAKRVVLAMTLLSLGTPMLLAGDEIGHSQGGNNNAYCQDNATTWLHWDSADQAMIAFVKGVVALRRRFALLQSVAWWQTTDSENAVSAYWFDALGLPMQAGGWDDPHDHAIALVLRSAHEECLLIFNGGIDLRTFTLPAGQWVRHLDTHAPDFKEHGLSREEALAPGSLWLAFSAQIPAASQSYSRST